MKPYFFSLYLLISVTYSYSQENNLPAENPETAYSLASLEVKPEFPGGINEFYKYIGKSFKAPSDKTFKGGKVFASFVIEKDGSVTDVKILRDCGFGTGEEAKRVLLNCPKWQPATQKNVPVRCQYAIPIVLTGN
jgi:protein TonB